MKNTWLRFAAAAAIAGGLLLSAQEPGVQQHRPGARIAQYLNLTPAQEAQATAEFQAARQSARPIRGQLKQIRLAMSQAVRANDTAKIDQLSAQEANLKGQISALRHQAFARLYTTLTPEQKAKADQLPAQIRQHRVESHQTPPNG
jgi:Spy/CpxP family protein refolding chaperone